jgi:Alcohol dehydrogenase GroES-like domain
VHIWREEYPVEQGRIVGHEPVGTIHELGEAVQGYDLGERVDDRRMATWQLDRRRPGGVLPRSLRSSEPRKDPYRRFLYPIKHLSPRDLAYFTEVDHHDHEALIALDANDQEVVGGAVDCEPEGRLAPRAAEPLTLGGSRWDERRYGSGGGSGGKGSGSGGKVGGSTGPSS